MRSDPALRRLQQARPFKHNHKPLKTKLGAVRTYLAGPSLRATVELFRYECRFSHEALRQWVALDGRKKHVIFSWITTGRSGLDALIFIKNVLRRCRDRPHFMVDRGVWYPWALNTLDLRWNVQRGGARNHVENYFGSFKHRLRRMIRRPGTWHTPTSYQVLLDGYGFTWNERLS